MNNIRVLYNKRIVLYGFGAYGNFLFDKFSSIPSITIVSIIDDKKAGQRIKGQTIVSLENFTKEDRQDFDLILLTSTYYNTLQENLKQFNLEGYYFDLFRSPIEETITTIKDESFQLLFSTPNYLSKIATENLNLTEPKTIEWIKKFKHKKTFYDVGASNGCFSLIASSIKEIETFSLEPDNGNFSLMVKNIELNRENLKGKIFPFNIALDNESGTLTLNKLEDYEGAHSKVLDKYSRNKGQKIFYENNQKVLTYSLDELIENHLVKIPNYIKIDVDGAEFSILDGAKKTLQSSQLEEILIETDVNNQNTLMQKMEKFNFSFVEMHKINEIIGGEIQGTMNYLFKK